MTKKHFQYAAEIIRKEVDDHSNKVTLARFYSRVALHFNGRFDPERFFKACGIEDKEV